MELNIYQVDAFTAKTFGGNSAAVCALDAWISDALMQQIAMENNLSETAFIVKVGELYHIRWFTPTLEIPLCGHATLAAAHVLFEYLDYRKEEIVFTCLSGELRVKREGKLIVMNFPADPVHEVPLTTELSFVFPTALKVYKSTNFYLMEYATEEEIVGLQPDFRSMRNIKGVMGIIVTAPGKSVDFVSRFFGPQSGIDEDPVTGSAHCSLTPFWAKRLGRSQLNALQLSARKGVLSCKDLGERVEIAGQAVTYMIGKIIL